MNYILKIIFIFLFSNSLLAEEAIFHKNLKIKKKDTTVNVKGGFKIIREKFYKNFKKENNLDYNFLEVTKNNPRYGNTALKLTLGVGCIGSKADCKRANFESKKRVEVSAKKIGKKNDNVWMTMSVLIPEDFKFGGRLTIQQWHNDIEVYEPMFETDLKNFVGLTMKNGSMKGYFVLDKPNKNCSAGSGDGSTGANFCPKAYQEFKLLNWEELTNLKGKWIDIIHNINFHSDPEKGYFKIWVNGNLKVDEKGQTIWKTHGDVEKYFGKNRWDFKFGIYTTSKMAYKLYFDEIWIKRSCKNLKLGRLGYSCKKLNDQNGGVKPFVIKDISGNPNLAGTL